MTYILPKKLAVIEDLSSVGRCSLSVAIPVISACGVQACPLPTAVFSNHTGYSDYYKTDLTSHLLPNFSTWEKLDIQFDGILCGYLGDSKQMELVSSYINQCSQHPLIFIDPVMGDHGKLYSSLSASYVNQMKDFISHAELITPNITEACLLTDTPYTEDQWTFDALNILCKKLHSMGPKQIILTGIPIEDSHSQLLSKKIYTSRSEFQSHLCNFISDSKSNKVTTYITKKCGTSRPGTGDIFASIVAAMQLREQALYKSTQIACDFIAKTILASDALNVPVQEGVVFENFLCDLSSLS